jgi:hypothetical protein
MLWLALSVAVSAQEPAPVVQDSTVSRADSALRLSAVTVRGRRARSPWAPPGSSILDARALDAAGTDRRVAMRLARAAAGVTLPSDQLYVDGVPATELPDLSDVVVISINADPLSVLYDDADVNVVHVETRAPPRRPAVRVRYAPAQLVDRGGIAGYARHDDRGLSAVAGIRGTPLSVAVQEDRIQTHGARPVFSPHTGAAVGDALFAGESRSRGVSVAATTDDGAHLRLRATAMDGEEAGAGAGGLNAVESGVHTLLRSRALSTSAVVPLASFVYRTRLLYRSAVHGAAATATSPSVYVRESYTGGSAPQLARRTRGSSIRGAMSVANPHLLLGWSLSHESDDERSVPNPHGQIVFGSMTDYEEWLEGLQTGVSYAASATHVRQAQTAAALFGQREWRLRPTMWARAGLRMDRHGRAGLLASPRLALSWTSSRLTMTHGAGVFHTPIPNVIKLQSLRSGCAECSRVTVRTGDSTLALATVTQGLRSAGSLVTRHGLAYEGTVSVATEYAYSRGFHRLGTRRAAVSGGFADILESNRALRRHQLHTRVSFSAAGISATAHHEWMRAIDNSAGPFAFGARQADAASDWAPSLAMPGQHLAVVLSPPRIAGVATTITFVARSSPPIDLFTGGDAEGLLLFADRLAGRRNAGRGAPYSSLDWLLSRRTRIAWRWFGAEADIAVHAENILGAPNYTAFVSNSSSASFGRPVASAPGRTVRMTFGVAPNFARNRVGTLSERR